MKTKHTAGAWELYRHVPGQIQIRTEDGEMRIASLPTDNVIVDSEANAKLIVVAPEMLAALKQIVDAGYFQGLKDLISRAEGK